MSDSVSFSVGERGEPALLGEGEQVPATDLAGEQLAPVAVALPGWTPEEAATKVAHVLTGFTLALYIALHRQLPTFTAMERLEFQGREFPSTGTALAPLLDRFVPRGGAADIGLSIGAIVGELTAACLRRVPVMAEAPAPELPGAARATQGPVAGSDTGAAAAGGSYHMPRDLAQSIPERPLEGLGL